MMVASKICLLTETYYPVVGGGETQARALAHGLTANGYVVTVLTRRSDPTLAKIEQFGPVKVIRLPPVGPEHFKKWGFLVTAFAALARLRRDYDLIFVSGFRVVGLAAVLVSCLLGKRCVLKADSLGEMSGDFFAAGLAKVGLSRSALGFRLFLTLRNKLLRSADAFVAISSEVAQELARHGVKRDLIWAIPNSVNVNQFQPVQRERKNELRRKLGLADKAVTVIYTGRLVSYKGLPLLLRVWRELQAHHPQARLVLVGPGGLDIHSCEAELKHYVQSNHLEQSVYFTGGVQNVHEYLQASDIFVFPTESEAFGISLIEAMACGLPVISTPVGGVKDILQDRHNGLVVAVGDFQQLYQALERLLSESTLAAELGRAARETAQRHYAVDIVMQKYIALFSQVIRRGS
jgi:glycosyltransferase involved in cell wall biosynthesis